MTEREEIAFSRTLSPQELVIWHGMGAKVSPDRMADLKAEIERRHVPEPDFRESWRAMWDAQAEKYRPVSVREPKSRPVVWEGRTYPNLRNAAAATGVTPKTLRRWLAIGKPRPHACPVVIDGVAYPTRAAAAEALGVNPETLGRRLARGEGPYGKPPAEPRPVTIDGQAYPSEQDAARALGVHVKTVRRYERSGRVDGRRPRAVVVNGVAYPSISRAASEIGVPSGTLNRWLSEGRLKGAPNGGDDDGDKADRPEGRDRADAGQRDPRPDLRRAG